LAIENATTYAGIYESKYGISTADAAILGGMTSRDTDAKAQEDEIAARAKVIRKKYGNNKELIERWAEATGV
jgi:hypothetical protein